MTQDALSDVLRGVRLRGAVFFSVSGTREWVAESPAAQRLASLLMPGVEHVIAYHAVARGSCWTGIAGGPSAHLAAGDIVMFPHGDAHTVASAPGLRGNEDMSWLTEMRFDPSSPVQIAMTGTRCSDPSSDPDDADAVVVCGYLGCDLRPFNPLIDVLPRLLHLQAGDDRAWMVQFTQQAAAESRARRPGAEAMLARMSEMMFVDAVRRYTENLPADSAGWLAGLRDRFVGRALASMHDEPARDWTLDQLGQRIGLSRSALHERFVALVGMPPMQYLARWRMQAAARLLLDTQATIAAIALEVGYDSEAAFARAFKRLVGKPPAMWRREHVTGATAAPIDKEPVGHAQPG